MVTSEPPSRSEHVTHGGRRWLVPLAVAICAAAAVCSAGAASSSIGSPLQVAAGAIRAFSSDGVRYAAWQVAESQPIMVVDTVSARRWSIASQAGCSLADQEAGSAQPKAAAGRFLVECNKYSTQSLLDVNTGASIQLPHTQAGYHWNAVGARYVEGWGGEELCRHSRAEIRVRTVCLALYDLVTGKVTDRTASEVPDLNYAGAPPICQALRGKAFAHNQIGLPRTYGYDSRLLAEAGGRPGEVRVYRCHRAPTILHTGGEPVNFDVRGGLMTWDTGHDARFTFEGKNRSHGVLTSYMFSSHRRRSVTLPRLTFRKGAEREAGVFGYSTHTANTAFWIASRINEGPGEEISAVYEARLK